MEKQTEILVDVLTAKIIDLEKQIDEQIKKRKAVQESLDAALRENEDLKNDAVELGKIIDEKNDRIKELEDIVKSPIPCRTCQSKCIVSNC